MLVKTYLDGLFGRMDSKPATRPVRILYRYRVYGNRAGMLGIGEARELATIAAESSADAVQCVSGAVYALREV